MKEFKQSRYLFAVSVLACVVLSYLVCLLGFNVLGGNISKITTSEWLCALAASIGVDIIFTMFYYEAFEKTTVRLYDDKITFGGKTIMYADILDVNIDSTLNKSVKRVYINSASEQLVLMLGSYGFTQLFEKLPAMKTDFSGESEKIEMDSRMSVDTLTVRLLNCMFYLTIGMGIFLAIAFTFTKSNGGKLISAQNKEYVLFSACAVWIAVFLCQIIAYVVTRLKYSHYTVKFYDDNVVIIFGRKIINNREIKKANVNAVRVTQTLVGRIAGKYRVKLITDSIGGGTNEFNYFPYLLSEEQKDTVLRQFLGEEVLDMRLKRVKIGANIKSILSGLIATAVAIVLAVFYGWTCVLTLIPVWYLVWAAIYNKRYGYASSQLLAAEFGINPNMLYLKMDKIESVDFQKDLFDKFTAATVLTIYLYGYKEQLFLGGFDDELAKSIAAKLKK